MTSFSRYWKFTVFPVAVLMGLPTSAQDLKDKNPSAETPLKAFEQKITTKVLPNGLTVIVCERPEAPVFSYTTFVDAGDVDDPSGQSGLAHMFEHLAFKGTTQIGTNNWPEEQKALEKVEATEQAYRAEKL